MAYSVQAVSGGARQTFAPVIENLRKNGTGSSRIIIYCQTITLVSHVYGVFSVSCAVVCMPPMRSEEQYG